MITKHIKQLRRSVMGHWIIELWNGQLIAGTSNLAESINKAGEFVWPMPELSATMKIEELPEELKAA